jgi:predicted nucleic-acid-binding Zn-ribbon protein
MAEEMTRCPKCGHSNPAFGNTHADHLVGKNAAKHSHSFIAGGLTVAYLLARFRVIPIKCASCSYSYRWEKE